MRTRRSARNQGILWRALTPPATKPAAPAHPGRCFDCDRFPPDGIVSRRECVLRGDLVYGSTTGRECFRQRNA